MQDQSISVQNGFIYDGVKSIGNARFNFWIDIPVDWDAEDRSENGDGYFLLPGDNTVDLRVYGGHVMPENDYTTEMLQDPANHPIPFYFNDGYKGVSLTKREELYFIRTERNVHIIFYAKAQKSWLEKHESMLKTVASSLRFGRRKE
ncbi:MAG TPA: hypothetical protein DCZ94_21955 [Lentisphaeria bacterium]|nr:MAG: hypothetical protein A2X48_14425 [Lentisphaerae bacterium GWF2_49_21]HBC89611.1 hypothetical protein [Lentisphaeria bacterium]